MIKDYKPTQFTFKIIGDLPVCNDCEKIGWPQYNGGLCEKCSNIKNAS